MEELNLVDKTLGSYQILQELGRGGMGVVYRAYQPSLNRYVAIKVLPPALALDQELVERFVREARAAARLRHPNIVVIHDVGRQGGLYYIVMELIEGTTLAQLIKRQGALPLDRTVRIVQQVAGALDYAHQNGFVHRDVKPANIFVGPNDHVTLTDFGIAKAAAGASLTRTGALMGTPEYMAPEQISGQPVTPAVDQYALGIVTYQMLSGQLPFHAESPHAVLYQHVQQPPPPLPASLSLPPGVSAALGRALAKEPQQRFPGAGAFAAALSAAAPAAAAGGFAAPAAAGAAAVAGGFAGMGSTRTPIPTPTPAPTGAGTGRTGAASAPAGPGTGPAQMRVEPPRAGGTPPSRRAPIVIWVLLGAIAVIAIVLAVLLAGILGPKPDVEATALALAGQMSTQTAQAWTATALQAGSETPAVADTPSPGPTETATALTDTPTPTASTSDTPTATSTATGPATDTATPTPSFTPTHTPTPTPTPPPVTPTCAVQVDAKLAAAWDRAAMGCPTAKATVVWSAWEPFQAGYMWWREDEDRTYALFWKGGTNPKLGEWHTGGADWKWDGSFPDGRGLTPPAGLFEPVRGFGYVWYNFLGGPGSAVGWATDTEKGFCSRIQPFEKGLIFRSSTVEFCDAAKQFNWATNPAFTPLFFAGYDSGTWQRY
jgi:Protein kinase domain